MSEMATVKTVYIVCGQQCKAENPPFDIVWTPSRSTLKAVVAREVGLIATNPSIRSLYGGGGKVSRKKMPTLARSRAYKGLQANSTAV
jgi:hypothetical protein